MLNIRVLQNRLKTSICFQKMGYKFILETRTDTKLSKPLKELVDKGELIHKIIDQ